MNLSIRNINRIGSVEIHSRFCLCYEITSLQNKKKELKVFQLFFVGLPGLEPGKTGPESVVLPLHHSPIFQQNHPFRF